METNIQTVSRRRKLLLVVAGYLAVLTSLAAFTPTALGAATDEEHLVQLEGEIKSIAERVTTVENSIKVVEAQRLEAETTIGQLAAELQALLPGLQMKTEAYRRKQAVLREAINLDYKQAPETAVELLAESGSISETLTKASYHNSVTEKVDTIAQEAEKAKDELSDHKRDLDGKRSSQEVLRRQLVLLAENINHQKAELSELLANRNNEAAYTAERIAKAKSAEAALLGAASGNALWGTFQDGAKVTRGQVIGFEGSTGFSTGCHTHFSVIENGKWANPEGYWNSLEHPAGSLTQPFGMTPWARTGAYGGDIHNGIDVVQGCGKSVKAAADGTIIRDNRTDGSGYGHYIMIRHAGGLITLYGHLI